MVNHAGQDQDGPMGHMHLVPGRALLTLATNFSWNMAQLWFNNLSGMTKTPEVRNLVSLLCTDSNSSDESRRAHATLLNSS